MPSPPPQPWRPFGRLSIIAIVSLLFLSRHVTVGSCACSCLHIGLDTLDCADFDLVFSGVPLLDEDDDSDNGVEGKRNARETAPTRSVSTSRRRWAWQTLKNPVTVRLTLVIKDEFNLLPDLGQTMLMETAPDAYPAGCAVDLTPGVEQFFVLSTLGLKTVAVSQCDFHGPLVAPSLLLELAAQCCPKRDSGAPMLKGDIDEDGAVDDQDESILRLFLSESEGLLAEDLCQFPLADMNSDQRLSAEDLERLEDAVREAWR